MAQMKDVAIIMDGNGRWAKSRLKPRVWGHIRGASIVNSIVESAKELKLNSLTFYTFSSENWSRPENEVRLLLKLFKKFLIRNKKKLIKENLVLNVIGNYNEVDIETKSLINNLEKSTKDNTGLKLNIAFGYGGRDEIVDSVNSFIEKNPGQKISKIELSKNLYNDQLKEIDLIIRTGGDKRISNFLIWQSAYAEIAFVEKKWPDFNVSDFEEIIHRFSGVERRYGSLEKNLTLNESEKLSQSNKRDLL